MSEPLRTDSAITPGASGADDQAARIEQLLLSGLDHYFAGSYEQAINVWTRVIFLERGHGRARAYIERARSALAERQRESEELLHRGVAAYHAGDVDAARNLLSQAVNEGGASDEALVFLQRLNRVDVAGASARAAAAQPVDPAREKSIDSEDLPSRRWVMPVLIAATVLGAVALGSAPLVSWLLELRRPEPSATLQSSAPAPLPVVRTADMILIRARDLHAGGHLHDALSALDRIDIGDPLRDEADRLKGAIQRDLLAAAWSGSPSRPEAAPVR